MNILLYQFGKVASIALRDALQGQFDVNHVHHYLDARNILSQEPGQAFVVINIVRNFYDRNISAYFQNMDNKTHLIWYLGDRNHIKTLSIERLQEEFKIRHLAMLGFLENWYYHFNVTLGVNIYDSTFDRERGFLKAETERFRIFIIRYEDIKEWNDILPRMLPIDKINIRHLNVSNEKWHSKLYEEFKRKYRFSEDEHIIIENSRVMNHFYTKDEMRLYKSAYA